MRVDEHLVVEPIYRVVKRRVVEVDPDPRLAHQGPVVHECEFAPGRDAVAEWLITASGSDANAFGITKRDTALAARGRLLTQKIVQVGILLVEEDCCVHEDVDRPVGAAKQRRPQVGGDIRTVRVDRNQLRLAHRLSGPILRYLGPQIGLVFADQLDKLPAVAGVRHPSANPALYGLRVNTCRLDYFVKVDSCRSHRRS